MDQSDSAAPIGNSGNRALLLNATHEPLAILAGRRALVLVLAGKAECLQERGDAWVHAPSAVLALPAVLRLRRYVRVPVVTSVPVTRAGILRRDRRRCVYCRAPGDTIDHVVPRSRGGGHSWENCVTCCSRCNARKADRLLSEIGWILPAAPAAPRRIGSLRVFSGDDADPVWQPWLPEAA
jgi:5-methylcytosine-specific restriction endonuclease McrA